MAAAKPTHWFAVKRYGWGWGMPVRWQGWVVLFGYLGLVYAGIRWLAPSRSASVLAFYLLTITAFLVVICAWKGERPLRWRWGGE
jgi:hypothetical protein